MTSGMGDKDPAPTADQLRAALFACWETAVDAEQSNYDPE